MVAHAGPADWARDWSILRGDGGFDWQVDLKAALAAATGGNGLCGLRLMWNLLGELAAEPGGAAAGDQAALLARTFGPISFVQLSRRDGVAQAVSRHRAEASGIWHLGIEAAAHRVEPRNDFARITGYLGEVAAENAAWDDWFAANAITPLRVAYEDLSADPAAATQAVLTIWVWRRLPPCTLPCAKWPMRPRPSGWRGFAPKRCDGWVSRNRPA